MRMIVRESTERHWDVYFPTWGDYVTQAEQGTSDIDTLHRSSMTSDKRFTGSKNMAEAVRLARVGWSDGAERMRKRLDVLYAQIPSTKLQRVLTMSVVGPGTLDMGRYIQGHPQSWVTWPETGEEEDAIVSTGRIVRVTFNMTTSAGVGTEEMFEKGAVVCALVDLLERSNRRVELSAVMRASDGGSGRIDAHIMVKDASEPLDVDRTAFALAHASCFRRLMFSIMEQAPKEVRRHVGVPNGGYGIPDAYELADSINVPQTLLTRGGDRERQAWLREELRKQGVEWEEA